MLNISGMRSSPVIIAVVGVLVIVLGLAEGRPPLAVVGVVLLGLAVFRFLTGSR